jgi:hypothetical protein
MTRLNAFLRIALLLTPGSVLAEPMPARFELRAAKVDITAPQHSADDRYQLHTRAELAATTATTQRYTLKARSGANCQAPGDAVFSNGFE